MSGSGNSDETGESFFHRLFSLRSAVSALFLCPFLLTVFGFMSIGSASIFEVSSSRPYKFVVLQVIWFLIALAVMAIVAYAPFSHYRLLKRDGVVIAIGIFAVVSLALVLIPGIGLRINGSRRWINLKLMNIQPSEFAKVGYVIVLAKWFDWQSRLSRTFTYGLLIPGAWCGVMLLLLGTEPDIGSCMLVGAVTFAVMTVGGAPKKILFPASACLGLAGGIALMHDPVRGGRILAFLHPELYADREAYQQLQAIAAFKNGGLFGVGFGNSMQKLAYLPEAHTDCVIAIAGEEFGFVAMVMVIAVFLVMLVSGICISRAAHDRFGRLLAFGLTLMLITQAGVNFGVNTGCLPAKGMALPFISYGGTSLLASWILVGILVNIGRVTLMTPDEENAPRPLFKNNIHRI